MSDQSAPEDANEVSTLLATWKRRGVDAAGGCSLEALRQFERNHAVMLTPVVRRYLSVANGMSAIGVRDFDELGFSFWPLERWTTAGEELMHQGETSVEEWLEKAFVFADYMTRSWSYAIYLGHENAEKYGAIFRVGSPGVTDCAASFEAFLRLYAENSRHLYGE